MPAVFSEPLSIFLSVLTCMALTRFRKLSVNLMYSHLVHFQVEHTGFVSNELQLIYISAPNFYKTM